MCGSEQTPRSSSWCTVPVIYAQPSHTVTTHHYHHRGHHHYHHHEHYYRHQRMHTPPLVSCTLSFLSEFLQISYE